MHGHSAIDHGAGAERVPAHPGKRGPARKSFLKKSFAGHVNAPTQFAADVHKIHPAVASGQAHTQKGIVVIDFFQSGENFLFRHMTKADGQAIKSLKVQRDLALHQRLQLVDCIIEIERVFTLVL